MIRLALAALIFAAGAVPALAYPNCLTSGATFEFRFGIGDDDDWTETDEDKFLLARVRGAGIDADTAERSWLDCIKITRFVNGSWETEYLDPVTLDPVE
jgi:hypothetical protein